MAITDEVLNELLKDYQKPEDLLGQNGLLKQLQKWRRFNLFNHFPNSSQQPGIGDRGQVCGKRFAKERVHPARPRRWEIFLRLVTGDFSPS